jgi:hypothetical protein
MCSAVEVWGRIANKRMNEARGEATFLHSEAWLVCAG